MASSGLGYAVNETQMIDFSAAKFLVAKLNQLYNVTLTEDYRIDLNAAGQSMSQKRTELSHLRLSIIIIIINFLLRSLGEWSRMRSILVDSGVNKNYNKYTPH